MFPNESCSKILVVQPFLSYEEFVEDMIKSFMSSPVEASAKPTKGIYEFIYPEIRISF